MYNNYTHFQHLPDGVAEVMQGRFAVRDRQTIRVTDCWMIFPNVTDDVKFSAGALVRQFQAVL